jgi:DNA-binding transcriptional ArsR family regulator
MGHRSFKDALYPQFARVAQALASDKRLELVDLLAQAPRHVDALAQETGMSLANVSQHLQVLRASRWWIASAMAT